MLNIIVDYLRRFSSPEHPVTGKNIGDHFGFSDIEVRKYINQARTKGIPVCSNCFGYYYSEDHDEIMKTVESLKRRITAQENAIDGLKAILA